MNLIKWKSKIIIFIIAIVLIFIINESTAYYSPSITNKYLDEINNIDWSIEHLSDYGFRFDGFEALLTINDDEGSMCYISVTPNNKFDGNLKKYKELRYSTKRIQFGIFDIRRYLDSQYIFDSYTFICDGVCITVNEHTFKKSKLFFMEFANQINNGEGKIDIYQTGFAKYCE